MLPNRCMLHSTMHTLVEGDCESSTSIVPSFPARFPSISPSFFRSRSRDSTAHSTYVSSHFPHVLDRLSIPRTFQFILRTFSHQRHILFTPRTFCSNKRVRSIFFFCRAPTNIIFIRRNKRLYQSGRIVIINSFNWVDSGRFTSVQRHCSPPSVCPHFATHLAQVSIPSLPPIRPPCTHLNQFQNDDT
jgi:hypothetical protein